MQRTRWQILGVLKRRAGASLDELAQELRLSSMTVREHLRTLEAQDYVMFDEVRRGVGRPHLVYHLTESAEDLLPKQYATLADHVLEAVKTLQPEDLIGLDERAKVRMVLARAVTARPDVEMSL